MSFFGQPPLSAYLPLAAAQNLSDLSNPAAARTNLGVLSASDTMMNSVPLGTVIAFYGSTAPVGYLPCFGQTVNSSTYPDLVAFLGGTTSAVVPDLRGEFLRGWDNGRGVDPGRTNLSAQSGSSLLAAAASMSSAGQANTWVGTSVDSLSSSTYFPSVAGTVSTSIQTGVTRPRNIAVMYCIKAYGSLVNATVANIGNVLSELSNTVKLSQFGVGLSANGYQKLPSGLIIQWGSVVATTAGATASYPIAFPNAVFRVVIGTANGNTLGTVSVDSASATSVIAYSSLSTCPASYIAIGY